MVPARAGPVVAAAVKLTVPLPVPLTGATSEIHASGVVADQVHPAALVTVIGAPAPPLEPIACEAGLTDNAHDPAWVTVNVWPAIVIEPVREEPALDATPKFTVPLPLPPAGAATVIQVVDVAAVHAQPAAIVTAMGAPAPPLDPID